MTFEKFCENLGVGIVGICVAVAIYVGVLATVSIGVEWGVKNAAKDFLKDYSVPVVVFQADPNAPVKTKSVP